VVGGFVGESVPEGLELDSAESPVWAGPPLSRPGRAGARSRITARTPRVPATVLRPPPR